MFEINGLTINVTRGDTAVFTVNALDESGEKHLFQKGDVIRFKVTEKKACESVVLQKEFAIEEETEQVEILLTGDDTKIGDVASKPVDYWYEVELNPFTNPKTIIGYDEDGAKILRLYPEANDVEPVGPTPEEIPVVDTELDSASERPVQNQAIARAFLNMQEEIDMQSETIERLRYELEVERARIDGILGQSEQPEQSDQPEQSEEPEQSEQSE